MSLSSSSTPAAMVLPTHFLSLKLAKAHKNGARSHGYLLYRVLTDLQHEQLFITLVGNDGAGCYSREVIPLSKIEHCLQGVNVASLRGVQTMTTIRPSGLP